MTEATPAARQETWHGSERPRRTEFVTLMALMTSLVALSIDAMLPALGVIGQDLGVARRNDTQLIIAVVFLGLAIAQMIYGPMSDAIGRKPAIYAGFLLFMLGSLLSMITADFTLMLLGRLLQGIGAAGPRIVVVALIRDQYKGDAMARIVSLVMAVFIMVPVLAPVIGQWIMLLVHWRAIFAFFLVLCACASVWFWLRQPETLASDRRIPFSPGRIADGVLETCRNRVAIGYTAAAGFVFGAFVGYLVSSRQIFQIHYGAGTLFPYYFAALALPIGSASFLNSRLVTRFGMRFLCRRSALILTGAGAGFLLIVLWFAGNPPFWSLNAYLAVTFFCFGILFGNFNALAMEPLGHIAGVGAAVVGSLTTFMCAGLGALIGVSFNGTVYPLVTGFTVLGGASLIAMTWAEQGRETSG